MRQMKAWMKTLYLIWGFSVLFSFNLWADEEPASHQESPVQQEKPLERLPQPETPTVKNEPPVRDVFQSELRPIETPVGVASGQPVEIQTNLEGLSMGMRGSRAVINGTVYKAGEEKLGIKVLEVRKKEVDILINQAIQRTLSMLPGETRDVPYAPEGTITSPGEGGEADTLTDEGQSQEPVYV
jgi:hypothetical protein